MAMTAPEREFAVARARAAEVEDFVRQRSELFLEAGQACGPLPDPVLEARTRERFLAGLEARTLLAWLARSQQGEAIGSIAMHLFLRLPSPLNPAGDEGYVVHLYTRPAWRFRGVGAALLEELLAEARQLGLWRLRLHTTAAGRPLYARFGFREHADNLQLVLGNVGGPA